jgi:copper ion binding protein
VAVVALIILDKSDKNGYIYLSSLFGEKDVNMITVKYSVPNISCGHCVRTIQNEVSELAGVSSVKADADTKTVEVIFDAPATEDQIKQLLAEINYPAAV